LGAEVGRSTGPVADSSALNPDRTIPYAAPGSVAGLDKFGRAIHVARPPVPKMKTKKAAAKRFRVTGKGRVRRPKAGGNHGMQEKSRKRLRRLRKNDMIHPAFEKHIKRLLPYS
jgi:large subunit ribosomal protein L35